MTEGVFAYPNGDKYEGEWKDNQRHGHGVLVRPDGTRYVGQWIDDRPGGMGTLTGADGSRYTGEWKDGKRHGQGTADLPDGTRYEGQWANDKAHGKGSLTYPDGTTHTGQWEDLPLGEPLVLEADADYRLRELEQTTAGLQEQVRELQRGKKKRRPLWKRWWVWAAVVLLAIVLWAGTRGEEYVEQEAEVVIEEGENENANGNADPVPQPDPESLWEDIRKWAEQAWVSVQEFIRELLQQNSAGDESLVEGWEKACRLPLSPPG